MKTAGIIFMALLLVACGAASQGSGLERAPAQIVASSPELELAATPTPPTKIYKIYEIKDLNGVSVTHNGGTAGFYKDVERDSQPVLIQGRQTTWSGWSYESNNVPLIKTRWTGPPVRITELSGSRVVDLHGSDPGLNPPQFQVILTSYDKDYMRMHVGYPTPDHKRYYVKLVGDSSIYVVDGSWVEWFIGNLVNEPPLSSMGPWDDDWMGSVPRKAPTPTVIPGNTIPTDNTDVTRLRGYVVQWLLDNCADNRPGEEANFRHSQLAGFQHYEILKTDDASWTFTSGTETWIITESPTLQVYNPHGNAWCLK